MVFAPFVGVQSPTPEKHALLAGAAGGAGPPPGTTLQVRLLNADALRPPLWFFRLWVQLPWTCPDWSKQPMQPHGAPTWPPKLARTISAMVNGSVMPLMKPPPVIRHPMSTWHAVQPSPSTELPSSHCSPASACMTPSPQRVQSFRQPSVSMVFPSSQASPACLMPSPQKVHCAGAPGARHVRPAGTDVPSHVSPSAACSWLSPHLVQSFRQPSVSTPLPSSHISPAWFTLPSPHTGLQRQSAPQVDVATQPVGTATGSQASPLEQACPAPHGASDVHGVFEPLQRRTALMVPSPQKSSPAFSGTVPVTAPWTGPTCVRPPVYVAVALRRPPSRFALSAGYGTAVAGVVKSATQPVPPMHGMPGKSCGTPSGVVMRSVPPSKAQSLAVSLASLAT